MKDKREKSKSLLKNIGLFFLASFIPKTISFFMVPLYTGCLTTEEYGILDLITTTVFLLLPILSVQVQDAVLRFTMEKGQQPAQVFSAGLGIVFCGFAILVIGTGVVHWCGLLGLGGGYVVYFLLHYLTGAIHNVVTYFLRAIDKVKHITAATVLNSVVTVGCNLLFLLVFRWGVNGYMLANMLGHVLGIAFMWLSVRLDRYITFQKPDKELIRRMMMFSIPMVVSALSWWVNNSLDKYILTWFCGVSASGLLAAAYKIPTIISAFGTTISKASSVSVLQSFDPEDTDGFLGQSYATISFLMVLVASGLMVLNIPMSKLLFSNDFFEAWQLVPPLLISGTMNHMSLSCEHICIALNRTNVISLTALLGALVNTALNLCLIPLFGAYGAALATAIGFFLVWLVRYIWINRHVKLKNCRVKEPVSYGLLLCQLILAYWGNRFILVQILVFVVVMVLYSKEISRIMKSILRRRK